MHNFPYINNIRFVVVRSSKLQIIIHLYIYIFNVYLQTEINLNLFIVIIFIRITCMYIVYYT